MVRAKGKKLVFVTNNSTKSRKQYAKKFNSLGISVSEADENLRLLRPSLLEAVEACVDVAGYEFDISLQRTLLRAASYGQTFSRNLEDGTAVVFYLEKRT